MASLTHSTSKSSLSNIFAQVRGGMARPSVGSLADFWESNVNYKLDPWQRDHLCPALERAKTEKGLRLLIHSAPQIGKSVGVSIQFPAWLYANSPLHKIVLITRSVTHSAEFGDDIVKICSSEDYRQKYPSSAVRPNASKEMFDTAAKDAIVDTQNSFVAVGVGGSFVGKGPDTVIFDDPYGSESDYQSEKINSAILGVWDKELKSRVSPDANVIVMFHRYGPNDLAAHLMDQGFEYLRFPGIADGGEGDPTGRKIGEPLCERAPLALWEQIKEEDPAHFYARIQGVPLSETGDFLDSRKFVLVNPEDVPLDFARKIRGWDIALLAKETADQSVGTLVGWDVDGNAWILDQQAFRLEFPKLAPEIMRIASDDGRYTMVGIEQSTASLTQVQALQHLVGERGLFSIRGITFGNRDKKVRAGVWATLLDAGRIRVVRGDWNKAFFAQVDAFTGVNDKADDRVDSVSVAFETMAFYTHGSKGKTTKSWLEEYKQSIGLRGKESPYKRHLR